MVLQQRAWRRQPRRYSSVLYGILLPRADDNLVLETAINGNADVIASFNIGDMAAGAARFGIAVERPASVLKRIRG